MFNRRLLFNGAGGNVVNHDFGLLVGTFDDVMIGIYHRGYFNSGIAEGSITPAEYIGYQIASCYLQLQFDPITTGLLINTFSFELFWQHRCRDTDSNGHAGRCGVQTYKNHLYRRQNTVLYRTWARPSTI